MAPAGASAAECSLDTANALRDSGGYEYDFGQAAPVPNRDVSFATLLDGGAATTTTPPGPRTTSDSWDLFGALFVGPGGDASLTNMYFSPDDNSCALEDGGREQVFPPVTVNGLTVQRKVSVAAGSLPGARVLDLITNPGTAAVTTSVQFGDTLSSDSEGDLGSDLVTAFRTTSSGDALLTTADFWAVTSDHDGGGGTTNDDLALAHVFDGPGGAERIDFATLTTGPEAGNEIDNLAWRWDNVRILPGQTAAFISYEVQQGVAGANAAAEDAAAANQARAYQTAPSSGRFAGMTPAEIEAVRNWSTETCFGRPATISGTTGPDTLKGTKRADVIVGGDAKDKLDGRGGADRICGGDGKDKLGGGGGNDKLSGGRGADSLSGGKGKDKLNGGKGKDAQKQ